MTRPPIHCALLLALGTTLALAAPARAQGPEPEREPSPTAPGARDDLGADADPEAPGRGALADDATDVETLDATVADEDIDEDALEPSPDAPSSRPPAVPAEPVDENAPAPVAPTRQRASSTAGPTANGGAADAEPDLPPIDSRREAPNYDGLPEEGPDAGEVMLWIPRILFGPITLVLDYGIRRPLGFFLGTAEENRWDVFILDLFTWNDRRSGIAPTFFLAFGLQPSVGFTFWSNDEIADGHQVRLSAGFGGFDFLTASGAYRIVGFDDHARIGLRVGAQRSPDRIFSGQGWDASSVQYRFREESYRASLTGTLRYWRESEVRVEAGVDGHAFDADGYAAFAPANDNVSLAEAIQSNEVTRPAGLDGYVAYRQRFEASVDTREPEPAPGHGFRAQGHAELAFDLSDPVDRRWVRYGGALGAFVDVGHRRVFGLWGLARFADPLGGAPIPFTELVEFGQQNLLLQGFLRGQLRGRSGVSATLEYTYPVWTRFDGRLHVTVGNVFGEHLEDFRFERLRLSFGLGLASVGDPDNVFQFGVAAGTAPFSEAFGIDSVQAVFGTQQGF